MKVIVDNNDTLNVFREVGKRGAEPWIDISGYHVSVPLPFGSVHLSGMGGEHSGEARIEVTTHLPGRSGHERYVVRLAADGIKVEHLKFASDDKAED